MDSIELRFKELVKNVIKIKQSVNTGKNVTVYLVVGDKRVGKKTFIHYLLDSSLQFMTDQEGQDVLNIETQQQKVQYSENFPEIYPTQNEQSFYFKIPTFDWENTTSMQKFERLYCLDYIFQELKTVNIKVLLLIEYGSDILSSLNLLKSTFQHIENYSKVTCLVITKPYDDDQFNTLTEQLNTTFIEQHEEFQFLSNIIEEKRIFCFYCEEVDDTKKSQTLEGLDSLVLQRFSTFQEHDVAKVIDFEPNVKEELWEAAIKLFNSLMQIVNASLMIHGNSLAGVQFQKNAQNIKYIETKISQITGQKQNLSDTFKANYSLQNKVKEKVLGFEKLKITFDQNPFNVVQELQRYPELFSQININQFANSYLEVITLLKKLLLFEISLKSLGQGALSDSMMGKIFKKKKQNFSEEFIKQYSLKLQSSSKKKKQKKIITYQQQKQKAGSNILEHMSYPLSPLKIDLFIDYLQKNRKVLNKQPSQIRDEKLVIKKLSQMFLIYDKMQFAIICSAIIPDFNNIEVVLDQLVKKTLQSLKQSQEKLSDKQIQFFKKVAEFCSENKRLYIVEPMVKKLLMKKFPDYLGELEEMGKKNHDNTVFMNYVRADDLFKKQKEIVSECIEYDKKHIQKIKAHIRMRYILQQSIDILRDT